MTETKTTKTQTKDNELMSELVRLHTFVPQVDDLVEGTVVEIGKNIIFVDLGSLGTGIIFGREIKENRQLFKELKSGDKISAVIAEPENNDGYIELSVKKAFREQTWNSLDEARKNKETIMVKITAANRGGLIINLNGIVGFLPVSQLATENYPRVEEGDKNKILQHLNKFVNKEMAVKVIDADPTQEKLIVSEKAMEAKKLKEVLSQYKVGEIVEGEISGVVDFGAFIKFKTKQTAAEDEAEEASSQPDMLEGLIHISELDWQLIEDPRKIIRVGDKVKAQIIGIDKDRLSLSLKALKEDPWAKAANKYKEGKKVKGAVTKFNPFGAFVQLDKDIQGLIHVSEFQDQDAMRAQLEIGKDYDFKITSVDIKSHKMALTLAQKKAAEEKAVSTEKE